MSADPTIVVFVGPTIDGPAVVHALAHIRAEVVVEPPAARGDVLRAAEQRVAAVGLIDGFYESRPSTGHKEILWALEQGVRVYGSSSMGAIRAAECAAFGMIGVGMVFDGFAAGELDDDDVALAHASAEDGYVCISEAMVNIRATLLTAIDQGIIDDDVALRLERSAKRQFYGDRVWSVIESAAGAGTDAGGIARFRDWRKQNGTVDQKRADAEAMLARIAEDLSSPPLGSRPAFRTTITTHFERMRNEERSLGSTVELGLWRQPLLEELQMQPRLFDTVAHEAMRRSYARFVGAQSGGRPEAASIDAASDRLRQRLGLLEPDALWAWLEEHNMTFDDYARMVEREMLSHLGTTMLPALDSDDLLDVARMHGLAEQLESRSAVKAELLRRAGIEESGHFPDGLTSDEALEWFCVERLGHQPPTGESAVSQLADRLGFPSADVLRAAVVRERRAADLGLD